jgi:hypothetical protein
MMDTDENEEIVEEVKVVEDVPRGKKAMTEKQQAALAAARAKAWERRKELGDISEKERQLAKKMKLLALKKRKQKVEQRLAKLEAGEDSSCTSSEEDEEPPPPKVKTKVPVAKPTRPSEEYAKGAFGEPPPPPRDAPVAPKAPLAEMSAEVVRDMLKAKIHAQAQAQAFASLFPGKTNPFL